MASAQQGVCWQTPRTAWVTLWLGLVFVAAAVKLAAVDHAWKFALYALGGALVFIAWFVAHRLRQGRFQVTAERLVATRRWGRGVDLERRQVTHVEVAGRLKRDDQRVTLTLGDGTAVRLGRVRKPDSVMALRSVPLPAAAGASRRAP